MIDIANNDANTVLNALEAGLKKASSDTERGQKYSLVVDGSTLSYVFAYEDNLALFRELADLCSAVICCRMSPLQKSEIVGMIKQSPRSPVTAAVGDGANDVSMIQEAHVGLGIAGKEGRAAVRSADFAFGKFKHLQRVLLVHGHWYYVRVSLLIQYFFYKNVAAFTAQVYFACINQFSTETLYDSLCLANFNMVYTALPVFLLGLFEQNIDAESLLKQPGLYSKIANNKLLALPEFCTWLSFGVWHSLVTFFGIYQAAFLVVSIKILLASRFWNAFLVGSVVLSAVVFVAFSMFYQIFPIFGSTYVIFHMLGSPGI